MPKLDDKKIAERLNQVMDDKRPKSQRAFALSIGTDPSFFAKVLKAERAIPESMIEGLEKTHKINRGWLLHGTGDKYVQNVPREKTYTENLGTSIVNESDHRDKLIASLERENTRLQKDLDLSLGELRHNILLSRAIAETNQELLIELLAGKNKKQYEEIADNASIRNGEKYQRIKGEGNFAYVGK